MSSVQLRALLTEAQLLRVQEIIKDHGHDSLELVRELRQYFAEFADELESKGVLPDYLAYAIAANLHQVDDEGLSRN